MVQIGQGVSGPILLIEKGKYKGLVQKRLHLTIDEANNLRNLGDINEIGFPYPRNYILPSDSSTTKAPLIANANNWRELDTLQYIKANRIQGCAILEDFELSANEVKLYFAKYDFNLYDWALSKFGTQATEQTWMCIYFQCLFAMYTLESNGIYHMDCHGRNFLVRRVKNPTPKFYLIDGITYQLPPCEWEVVLTDFGHSINSNREYFNDVSEKNFHYYIKNFDITMFLTHFNLSYLDFYSRHLGEGGVTYKFKLNEQLTTLIDMAKQSFPAPSVSVCLKDIFSKVFKTYII
uniref:Protein kinase domain-containing protein n=1 Tax=viral metagenome TaxID=1070528 RepID=A0A6C0CKQ7_9ZZZZ